MVQKLDIVSALRLDNKLVQIITTKKRNTKNIVEKARVQVLVLVAVCTL
jgi:hypothetical protein